MRVYDAQTLVNHLLQEGVFKLESKGGDLRKAIDCDPQLGISRIVIVNLQSNSWTEIKGAAKQYASPSWSRDGRFIAAIADLSPRNSSRPTSDSVTTRPGCRFSMWPQAAREE